MMQYVTLKPIIDFFIEMLWRAPLPPRRQDTLPSKNAVKRPTPQTPPSASQTPPPPPLTPQTPPSASQTPPPPTPTPPNIRRKTLGGLPIPMTGKTFSEIAFGPNDQCDRLDAASHTTNNCPPCKSRSTSVRRVKRVVFLGAIAITSGLSILFPPLFTLIPVLAGALINV